MASLNKVTLIGNVGKDPEIRQSADGRKIVNLSLATSETWKDKQTGEKKRTNRTPDEKLEDVAEFVDGDMTEEDRKKTDELLIKIAEENELHGKIGKLKAEIARLREALEEIKKTVEYAQDTVYPFHIALDSKDGVYILEVTKEALKGGKE